MASPIRKSKNASRSRNCGITVGGTRRERGEFLRGVEVSCLGVSPTTGGLIDCALFLDISRDRHLKIVSGGYFY